jgi:hypothetical protein
MERVEKSPYWGIAFVVALAAGVSFWAGLIWVVLRMIR